MISPAATALTPLGPLDKLRLITEVLAFYPSALRLVRSNDLERMVASARAITPDIRAPEFAHQEAIRLGVAVQRTLKFVPTDSRCLVRSVLLSRMLARRDIESRLVIGVKTGEQFAAHAWVEHEGRSVLPRGTHERLMEL